MIKLEEIIWEITEECHNNCSYCGSKDNQTFSPSTNTIIDIAKEIAKYPPSSVNISGGDPLLISYKIHARIIEIFKQVNIVTKLIVNPKSINKNDMRESEWSSIVELYDVVGISVNTEEELKLVKNELQFFTDANEKFTIITNFNKSNLWLFDEILEYIDFRKMFWQVQFTVYKDKDENAIYESELATKQLFYKLYNAKKNHYNYIVAADNMNSNPCSAGLNSLGILANGDVIPCLSMRTWTDLKCYNEGNILFDDLKSIWENKFKEQRFGVFKCCKDHCNKKAYDIFELNQPKITKLTFPTNPTISPALPLQPSQPFPGKNIYIYGVVEPIMMMYGVFQTPTSTPIFREPSSTCKTDGDKNNE